MYQKRSAVPLTPKELTKVPLEVNLWMRWWPNQPHTRCCSGRCDAFRSVELAIAISMSPHWVRVLPLLFEFDHPVIHWSAT